MLLQIFHSPILEGCWGWQTVQLSDHVTHPTRSMLPFLLLPPSSCARFPPPPPHITHLVCSSTSCVAGFSCPVYPSSEQEGAKHRIQGSHPLVLGLDGRGENWMEREGAREFLVKKCHAWGHLTTRSMFLKIYWLTCEEQKVMTRKRCDQLSHPV